MIESLLRPHLRTFLPYASARSLYKTGLFLDANENAFGSVVTLDGFEDLNRYPDPAYVPLRQAIADFAGVGIENVFTGNGSDEVIDLLIRLFVDNGEGIAIVEPTYGMYAVAAEVAGLNVYRGTLENDFQFDAAGFLADLPATTKIVFLCSPNNPTGNLLRRADIEEICSRFRGIVALDEAYIEFSSQPSLSDLVGKTENLVVLRTFSKAWGLAGIRVGYALVDRVLVSYLDRVKLPYNLNRVCANLALRALSDVGTMLEYRDLILSEREGLTRKLSEMGFTVYPSEANFLLAKYPGASSLAARLATEAGVIIRDFGSKPSLYDCVRITVGTPAENDILLSSLGNIL